MSAAIIVTVFVAIVIYTYAERDKSIVFHIPNRFASEDITEGAESVAT